VLRLLRPHRGCAIGPRRRGGATPPV